MPGEKGSAHDERGVPSCSRGFNRLISRAMAAPVALALDLSFSDQNAADDDWFDTLVAINQRWLGSYARLNPSFSVRPSLLERNSLWMNTHFQKQRMITSPVSKQAKALLTHHQKAVLARLRSGGSGGGTAQNESESSTALAEPVAALMFAASVDRCPEHQSENLFMEALELLQSRALRANALCSGFAGCVFRFLTGSTETTKRILALQLLVLLATDDAGAVAHSCKIAAQGQFWQPNMFIYTLQKRHCDNAAICDWAAQLLALFAGEMPVTSPIKIDSGRHESEDSYAQDKPVEWSPPSSRVESSPAKRTRMLPAITGSTKPGLSPHRPTTTISSLYVGSPSPYSSHVILPLARPPPSAAEQARRAVIYSTPKENAVAGDHKRRCLTPNITELKRDPSVSDELEWLESSSPPKSPSSPRAAEKKPIVLSEKYSWNPDCINSVSGFEWWWRSLPQHHTNLEPTQKLKMVTKAAVRLHTKGEWERAVELYLLALTMNVNDEVTFRLRVNLGCAYEIGREFTASETAFRAALEVNPDDPYARFKLGTALKELGRFDEAAVAYEAVLEAYPQAKTALEQLEEAKQEKIRREEAERAALVAARTARSPPKPGRRLLSRGHAATISLPRIAKPTSPAKSPKHHVDAAETSSVAPSDTMDLISRVEERSNEKKVDLRATLRLIDTDETGRIRLSALAKLLSALCGVDETTFLGWLPHEAVSVDAHGVVQYDVLLDALDSDAKRRTSRDPDLARQWLRLVETIKQQEVGFYASANLMNERCPETTDKVSQDAPFQQPPTESTTADKGLDSESTSATEGPSEQDVEHRDDSSVGVPSIPIDRPRSAEEDGYHSVSARLDAKREKARQETILRAERARVVARKHLHCVKALQEIAARARRQLAEQYEEQERQRSLEQEALKAQGDSDDQAEHDPDAQRPVAPCAEDPVVGEDHDTPPVDTVACVEPENAEAKPVADQDQSPVDRQEEEQDSPSGPVREPHRPEETGNPAAMTATASLSTSVVERAVAAATRRVVIAIGVAELQAVAASFARVVPETLLRLAAVERLPPPLDHVDGTAAAP